MLYQLKCNRKHPIKAICLGSATLVLATSLFLYPGQAKSFDGYKLHTVQPGQTLWSISSRECPKGMDIRKYIFEVEQLNQLDSAVIHLGQVLKLPKEGGVKMARRQTKREFQKAEKRPWSELLQVDPYAAGYNSGDKFNLSKHSTEVMVSLIDAFKRVALRLHNPYFKGAADKLWERLLQRTV